MSKRSGSTYPVANSTSLQAKLRQQKRLRKRKLRHVPTVALQLGRGQLWGVIPQKELRKLEAVLAMSSSPATEKPSSTKKVRKTPSLDGPPSRSTSGGVNLPKGWLTSSKSNRSRTLSLPTLSARARLQASLAQNLMSPSKKTRA